MKKRRSGGEYGFGGSKIGHKKVFEGVKSGFLRRNGPGIETAACPMIVGQGWGQGGRAAPEAGLVMRAECLPPAAIPREGAFKAPIPKTV